MAASGGRSPPIDATRYLIEKDGVTADEAAWYFGNAYGRAWWTVRRDGTAISDELMEVIDDAISTSPNLTAEVHDRLIAEILRLSKVK